jgi:nucleoside-diphosphate-sugar epimerase
VYGRQAHQLMHEGDPLHGCGAQAEAKIEAEHLCERARFSGLCTAVLRPTGIVGPGLRGAFARLYDSAFSGREFPMLGTGNEPCQVLDVEDVCQAIYQCLVMRADLVNDTFNLGTPARGSMRASVQAVLDRAGRGKRVIAIPRLPGRAALRVLEFLRGTSVGVQTFDPVGQCSYVSVRHIDRKLDFRPRYAGCDALVRNYEEYARRRGEIDGDVASADCPGAIS